MAQDYSKMTKEELVGELKRLKPKKYGLVWEEKTEDVVEECKTKLPVLNEVSKRAISKAPGGPTNIIIEGDNYHALSVLNYTHQGKIDAIYADPPYNTGAKNWKYNNDYVDGEDSFRHSKWLSFMEKRLLLARPLLKEDGIIVVTIDDYEVATLTLLMNEIFGEENHLGTVVIKNNPSGRSTTAGFAVAHEYALFYAKTERAEIGRLQRSDEQIARYKEKDKIGNFEWVNFRARYSTVSARLQYPIFIKKNGSDFRIPNLEWDSVNHNFKLLENPKINEFVKYPIDDAGQLRCWKWGLDTVRKQKDSDMAVRLDQKKQPTVYVKARMKDEGMLPLTWWDKTEYSATSYGTNLLSKILHKGGHFDYPKSLYAVTDCLRVLSRNRNATVLDFFAGSGTTGHAALNLNEEDGGNRKFILCTNNENKIAETVTYPRIQKVISGYGEGKNKVKGIQANVRYFKTDFINKTASRDEQKMRITERCTEMLCLREGVYNEVSSKKSYKIFKDGERVLAVYYAMSHNDLPKLKKELDKIEGDKVLYCFTLDADELDVREFGDWEGVRLEPIPQKILDIYKEIHEY